jgi:probable phosphoglycerate mutase
MSQIFYVVRHGETDWNVQRRLQGHSDIDLNAVGTEQAKQIRQRLGSIQIDHVIASDLSRARRTAELGFGTELTTTRDLREVFLGEGEGQIRDHLLLQYGDDFFEKWSSHRADSLDLRFKGGESKREMLDRFIPCLHLHLDCYPRKTLAFVSHGLAMRTFLHAVNTELVETQFIGNCGVLKMERTADRNLRHLAYFDPLQPIS